MRSIVNSINTPFRNTSKFFARILSNIVGNTEYLIKNSFEFFQEINNSEGPGGYKDMVRMYTNISVELTLKCVMDR